MMRISATGRRNDGSPADTGFSLVELLVATAVLAVISLVTVLSLRLAPGATPAARMEDLARAIRFLQEEAMYTRRNFALAFAHGSWRVLERHGTSGEWRPRASGRPYPAGGWDRNFETTLEIEHRRVVIRDRETPNRKPDIFLMSTGESTPFRLTLSDGAGRVASCWLDAFGELECRRGT